MPNVLYLFCLARSDLAPSVDGVTVEGLGDLAVRGYQDVAAVLSEVSLESLEDLGEDPGPEEAARVCERAMRHEEVVEWVMRSSGVLPARLGAVFTCWENLERVLKIHHDTIVRFLDQAAAFEEWAVKAFLDRAKAHEALFADKLAREEQQLAALSPGRRYLQEQRLRKALGGEVRQMAREFRRQSETALFKFVNEFSRRELFGPDACEGKEMLENWAFWIPKKNRDAFRDCLESVNKRYTGSGLTLECSGPWPPYSFSPRLEEETAP